MRRIRLADAARLVAPAMVYLGVASYAMSDDWRWLGAGLAVGTVTTLIEANRLCDRLARRGRQDETMALAESTGVLGPCHGPRAAWPPPQSTHTPAADADADLASVFAELEPAFAELDQRSGPRACRCGSAGAVASPRRDCPLHGGPR